MDRITSRVLVVLVLVNTALGSVIGSPKSAVAFENGPYGAWECQTAQGQVETIQPNSILRAAHSLVHLWDRKSHDRWSSDTNAYPQRLTTSEIGYWPEPHEDPDDLRWLCNLHPWVGSYPVIPPGSNERDPGPFRALVSSSYKKEGTGGDMTYVFGFCGVAIQVGDKYEMCWPAEEADDDEQ